MLIKKIIKYKTFYFCYMHYIQNLLSIYNIIEANLFGIPMIKKSTILLGKSDDTEFDNINYQFLVEKLIHLLQKTQLDLAFVISKLRQYMADLHLSHWHVTKKVL